MIEDERLNPGSTATEKQIGDLERKIDELKQKYILFFSGETKQPPEQEREETEKAVRKLIYGGAKSAKMSMIIQNLAARFSLYNNLWLKQLNEMESGVSRLRKKNFATLPPDKFQPQSRKNKGQQEVFLSLNDEESFEKFFMAYQQLLPQAKRAGLDKEGVINSVKSKLVTHNLVETKVSVTLQNGKPSITIKE
ncbi:MAG: hypothetical protein JXI33_05735 [Candidatus Aminicenantes bacterium]|nr:hypothetical protein [Candidatus Aminicenantes bacterium]